MTRELNKLLDDVRMNMEYDVYSRLHDEIMIMETDFEETLSLKEQNKALMDERANMQKTHRSTINSLEQQNTALQARIEELEKPKTCNGCEYQIFYGLDNCTNCVRGLFTIDRYQPKQKP